MDLNGLESSFLVIDPNSFGLVLLKKYDSIAIHNFHQKLLLYMIFRTNLCHHEDKSLIWVSEFSSLVDNALHFAFKRP